MAHVGLSNFITPSCTVPQRPGLPQFSPHGRCLPTPGPLSLFPVPGTCSPPLCPGHPSHLTFSGADLPFSFNLSCFGRFPVYALSIYTCFMCSLPCLLLFFSMALIIVSCPSCFIYFMCSLSPTNGVNSDRARILARVTHFRALVHRRCSVNVRGTKK